jgi:hypothetical protein
MELARAIERNTQTLTAYGRYCAEMHNGIGENRKFINTDREAASTTRVEVSKLRKDVTELSECMEHNNPAIDERFTALEQENATKATALEQFTKTLTDAYQAVYKE